jgi:hypothetical protein
MTSRVASLGALAALLVSLLLVVGLVPAATAAPAAPVSSGLLSSGLLAPAERAPAAVTRAKTRAAWLRATAAAWRKLPPAQRRKTSLAAYRKKFPFKKKAAATAAGPVGRYVAPTVTLKTLTCTPLDALGIFYKVTYTWEVAGGVYDIWFMGTETREVKPQSVNGSRVFTLEDSVTVSRLTNQWFRIEPLIFALTPYGASRTARTSKSVATPVDATWSMCGL